jgi:hypothetical protein
MSRHAGRIAFSRCDPSQRCGGLLKNRCTYCKERLDEIDARKRENQDLRLAEKEMLKRMSREERAAHRTALKVALQKRADANNLAMELRPGQAANLLTLPPEIRAQIYDLLYDFGSDEHVEVFTRRPPIRRLPAKLHQVCRIFRLEIDARFYDQQTFAFNSVAAMDLWRKKHGDRLALMRSVELYSISPLPIVEVAKQGYFQQLKSLTLDRPTSQGSYVADPGLEVARLYQRMSPGFEHLWLPHHLLAWRQIEVVVEHLPQFRDGVVEWTRIRKGTARGAYYCDRYSVRYRSESRDAINSKGVWLPVDVLVSPSVFGRRAVFSLTDFM